MTEQNWLWLGFNVFILAMLAVKIRVWSAKPLKAGNAS
jgi:hypothetical protein